MMRLIDADELYRETEKKIKANHEFRMAVVDDEFLDLIKDADTVDAVEVVRCEDCKRKDECNQYVLMCGDEVELAFCSHGVRKEGKENV